MREFVWLTWLNPLGGYEYWLFTGYKDHALDVVATGETSKNIFPGWPKSYGAHSDTIRKQTFRRTRKTKVIRSSVLTAEQVQEIGEQVKSSPVVQILSTRRDRRTVIVDDTSIVIRKERDKMHTISFTISYTDDYPSQTA